MPANGGGKHPCAGEPPGRRAWAQAPPRRQASGRRAAGRPAGRAEGLPRHPAGLPAAGCRCSPAPTLPFPGDPSPLSIAARRGGARDGAGGEPLDRADDHGGLSGCVRSGDAKMCSECMHYPLNALGVGTRNQDREKFVVARPPPGRFSGQEVTGDLGALSTPVALQVAVALHRLRWAGPCRRPVGWAKTACARPGGENGPRGSSFLADDMHTACQGHGGEPCGTRGRTIDRDRARDSLPLPAGRRSARGAPRSQQPRERGSTRHSGSSLLAKWSRLTTPVRGRIAHRTGSPLAPSP
jgi:hypothetical protein